MTQRLDPIPTPPLAGRKALVVGVANAHSIAFGCARAFHALGAELALTYLNDKAKPHVAPLAQALGAPLCLPLNVEQPGELESVFDAVRKQWGRLDILLHSIAFAPKQDLQGGLLDCSAEGFARAMDVSVHSFVRMAKLAAPLMDDGGTMFAMSYLGADWLTRAERIAEEQPEVMLDALRIVPGMQVADIGAGVGYHALRISPRVGAAGKVHATDLQPEMLELLVAAVREAGLRNVEAVRSSDRATGLPDATIDLALMVDVYHELAEPAAFMRDLRRAMAPGGRIALVESV